MKPFPLYLCVLWLCSVEQSEAAFGCVTRGARKGTPRGALQPSNIITKQFQILPRKFATLKTTTARATSSDEDHDVDENDVTIVTPGSEDEGVSNQMWDYIETGEPPKSVIIKQVRGTILARVKLKFECLLVYYYHVYVFTVLVKECTHTNIFTMHKLSKNHQAIASLIPFLSVCSTAG